jgi:uncharacterized membrane protein HdeD (DUF308 family)
MRPAWLNAANGQLTLVAALLVLLVTALSAGTITLVLILLILTAGMVSLLVETTLAPSMALAQTLPMRISTPPKTPSSRIYATL